VQQSPQWVLPYSSLLLGLRGTRSFQNPRSQISPATAGAIRRNRDCLAPQRFAELRQRDIIQKTVALILQHHLRHSQNTAMQTALALVNNIRGGNQACHADIAAKKAVFDGVDKDPYPRVTPPNSLRHLCNQDRKSVV